MADTTTRDVLGKRVDLTPSDNESPTKRQNTSVRSSAALPPLPPNPFLGRNLLAESTAGECCALFFAVLFCLVIPAPYVVCCLYSVAPASEEENVLLFLPADVGVWCSVLRFLWLFLLSGPL